MHDARRLARPPRGPALLLAATRPAFLTLTAVAVLLGWAASLHAGAAPAWPEALATLAGALLAHAGANVLNDYHDARNGSDAANVDRIAPFTGGSRFIQDGLMTEAGTRALGVGLLAAVVPPGLWLVLRGDPGLLAIGAAGLLLAWAYSAPPLALMSRGWGEAGVAGAWWLVVVGAAHVPLRAFDPAAMVAAAGLAASMATVLFVNQFPDAGADAAAGKRNWVVRAGVGSARIGPALLLAAGHAAVAAGLAAGVLPLACAVSFAAAVPGAWAAREVIRHAHAPKRLAPAIRATLAAAHAHGLLLAAGLAASTR